MLRALQAKALELTEDEQVRHYYIEQEVGGRRDLRSTHAHTHAMYVCNTQWEI